MFLVYLQYFKWYYSRLSCLMYFRQCYILRCHIPFSPFLCSFSFILITFRLLWCLSIYSLFCHSILHPLSIFHHPSLCPPSLSHHFFPCPCLPTPCLSILFYLYLLNIHSLLLAFPFQLCLPYILSLVTLWVILYILHTTPSIVVYKSFQLVVYSLACNCHPLLFTQSPLNLSPDNTINPLVSLLLVSSEIEDSLVPRQGCNT